MRGFICLSLPFMRWWKMLQWQRSYKRMFVSALQSSLVRHRTQRKKQEVAEKVLGLRGERSERQMNKWKRDTRKVSELEKALEIEGDKRWRCSAAPRDGEMGVRGREERGYGFEKKWCTIRGKLKNGTGILSKMAPICMRAIRCQKFLMSYLARDGSSLTLA